LLANQNEEAEEGQLLNDIAAIELGGDSNGTAQKFRTRIVVCLYLQVLNLNRQISQCFQEILPNGDGMTSN